MIFLSLLSLLWLLSLRSLLSLLLLLSLMILVFVQSSPVHPHFSIQGGGETWASHRRRRSRRTTFLHSNIGLEKHLLLCSVPTVSHCSVTLGHFWNDSFHGISQIQWSLRAGLAEDCLFSLAEWEIDEETPLITGPLRVDSTTRQNPPICDPHFTCL